MQKRLTSKRMCLVLIVMLLAALGAVSHASAAQSPQIPLSGSAIPQFAQKLPLLDLFGATGVGIATYPGSTSLDVHLCEFDASVLPPGTPGVTKKTRAWGYIVGTGCPDPDVARDTYLGPVLVSLRHKPTQMTFINDLGSAATTGVLAYKYSVDQTLHWADPLNGEADLCNHLAEMGLFPAFGTPCAQNYAGSIPAAVHLHGGIIPAELDGGPDAWVTSDGLHKGHGYYSSPGAPSNGFIYKYPNTQEAAPIWFHDHTLGTTRLNVYSGVAGGYIIEDPAIIPKAGATGTWVSGILGFNSCLSNCLPVNLPGSADIVPVIIQDRMFDTNGQLFYPADSAGGVLSSPNPEHPYWIPEFRGDTIVVNGKAWPYLEVQPKRYRFFFINGSDARTYDLNLPQLSMWVIGTEGGYLDTPVKVNKLLMQPGERYEVIIDFAGKAGQNLILHNNGKTPFPSGSPPNGATLGRIMQFRVQQPTAPIVDTSYDPASGTPLRSGSKALVRLVDPVTGKLAAGVTAAATRQLTFNEVQGSGKTVTDPVTGSLTTYPGGPLELLVNNTKWTGESTRSYGDFTPITLNGITINYSEFPREGDTEVWEFINLTDDAHAQHLHGIQFQVLNRQNFNRNTYKTAYAAAFPGGAGYKPGFGPPLAYGNCSSGTCGGNPDVTPFLQGPVQPPRDEEAGWKDTVIAYPGQVTRIVVRWAPTDIKTSAPVKDLFFPYDPSGGPSEHGFVHHCHIIEHDDNEMMRPDQVTLNPLAPAPGGRSLKQGTDY